MTIMCPRSQLSAICTNGRWVFPSTSPTTGRPFRGRCCSGTFRTAYKALEQNVPEDLKSSDLRDLSEWLGEMVRQVDSSLLDEWELLSHPQEIEAALASGANVPPCGRISGAQPPPLTANTRAFKVMVRNACFRRVELAAKRDWAALGEMDQEVGWDAARWEAAFAPYFAEQATIGTGPDARGPGLWHLNEQGRQWQARQVLDDPAGYHEWALVVDVNLDASDQRGEPACGRSGSSGSRRRSAPTGVATPRRGPGRGPRRDHRFRGNRVQAILLRAISGSPGGPANLCLMAMRPLGRDEALQHLFVLGTRSS